MRLTALVLVAAMALWPLAAYSEPSDAGFALPEPPAAILAALDGVDGGTPGRSVELAEGTPAPFTGNLSDKERWAHVAAKRYAAEAERDLYKIDLQSAKAKQAQAEQDRDSRPSWAVVFGVGAGALVVGIAGAVAIFFAAKK